MTYVDHAKRGTVRGNLFAVEQVKVRTTPYLEAKRSCERVNSNTYLKVDDEDMMIMMIMVMMMMIVKYVAKTFD